MENLDKDFIELMCSVCDLSGVDNLASTIFATLYIEPDEISMDELAKKTGYSLASISNKIKMLEHTGFISRRRKPGTRKVFLYMEKDYFKVMKKQLLTQQDVKIKSIKQKLPVIIEEYEKKAKSDEAKAKLKILKDYYSQTMKFDQLITEMLRKLDELE